MHTNRIDHIGIAVRDAKEKLKLYQDFLGLEVTEIEELPERGLRVYFIKVGDTRIELLEPMNENSEVSGFLEKKGEGIHHLAFNVHGIEEAVRLAKENGLQPLSEEPKKGAGGTKVLFLHPKTTGGVLIELVEGEH
ncbi:MULTISPECIES: methylmalonyl-CoA epimerase [Fervidobacterium]|uniref:Glyoxalase/bleomycin resistance protein/dioxygenase n=1 Tax=Fervidobacterium nodosum (strain ATCC 35602 / DSM 5306 / Rt17-B1) TaxID=381764 RepID=A7HMN0_FERNB|nr:MULTISPECIES: methylmalonyl-CoA epimerase [Fervidobacterium]ABS61163.1 Glyoxalase/bleomycin resistance protein/dioxygenase [Fervidobacterium nodosum Rt17-B1]KAF2961133.1 methylmalonyl-CoA epimerase [Fervidobacterium sp. 2310opik-2]PHJ14088.1 lactoylglutathione lyase [Fervidobacterium sp. SC_NGM5_G05]HOJ94090.1 methylmalonyl-CoA epimerase [Fervidobacterium nodosum]